MDSPIKTKLVSYLHENLPIRVKRTMLTRREVLATGGVFLATALPNTQKIFADSPQRTEGRVRLSNGRWLSYREYGNPYGHPVFYFHGTPGSRLEVSLCNQNTCCSGARIIAVDRPGIGRSSYQKNRRILDWPCDVVELAAALGYANSSFGIIGLSGGAPYAAVCAAKIPDRLTHVAIISGHTPPDAYGACPGIHDKSITTISRHQRAGKRVLNVVRQRLDRKPKKVIARVTQQWTTADRKVIYCNPKNYHNLVMSLREVFRCGPQGIVTDIHLLGSNWGFCLSDIQNVPVSLWQGGCDRIVTPSMAHYFHKHIAGSDLTIDPQAGHVSMFRNHTNEILSRFIF